MNTSPRSSIFFHGWNARLSYTRLENTFFDARRCSRPDVPVTLNGFSAAAAAQVQGRRTRTYGGSMDAFMRWARKPVQPGSFSHSIIKAWNQSWDTSDQAGYPIPDVKDWTGDSAPRWDILALSQTHRDEQTASTAPLRLQLPIARTRWPARWTRWQSSETSGGVAGYTHIFRRSRASGRHV